MTKSVAILGCGPAGLMAAHAAVQCGWDFRVYSKKVRSQLFGAQYLHRPIPNIPCGDPRILRYTLKGTPEGYRRKVYGDTWDGNTSPEDLLIEHQAWDIRAAYGWLWAEYQEAIIDCTVGPGRVNPRMMVWNEGHDLVVSSVPRKLWAEPGDVFESQKVWAIGDANEARVHLLRPPENNVICDGTDDNYWYRVSNVFGYCTMEWPYAWGSYMDALTGKKLPLFPPARGASVVEKPLRHNSTAASDFVHVGRYGRWEKGVLTSDAFYDTMQALAHDRV